MIVTENNMEDYKELIIPSQYISCESQERYDFLMRVLTTFGIKYTSDKEIILQKSASQVFVEDTLDFLSIKARRVLEEVLYMYRLPSNITVEVFAATVTKSDILKARNCGKIKLEEICDLFRLFKCELR